MHESVMAFLRSDLDEAEFKGRTVLEVGSQNINGSARSVIAPFGPASYVGIDYAAGRGVDLVVDAANLEATFGRDSFDAVISTEMLEHAQDWRAVVTGMKRVLKPGGLIVVTTRGPGFPYHGFPHDYWRYTTSHIASIFCDFSLEILRPDPEFPGVFLTARKPPLWIELDISRINVLSAPLAPDRR